MRLRRVLPLVASVAAASVAIVLTARAGDPPPGMSFAQKPIEHPVLKGEVGEWKVSWKETMEGETKTGKATSKIALSVGGTAVVEDYTNAEMMPGGFHGHGVAKVSDDGKTVNVWWFDSMSPEPMKLSGPLSADSYTISGEMEMGPKTYKMSITIKPATGGFDFDGTLDGKPWLHQEYRK